MKPKDIDHIVLICNDVNRTTDFYSKFLGKPIMKDDVQVAW